MVREQIVEVLQNLLMTFLKRFHLLLCIDIDLIENFPKDKNIYLLFHSYAAFRVVMKDLLYTILSENQVTKQPKFYYYSLYREPLH